MERQALSFMRTTLIALPKPFNVGSTMGWTASRYDKTATTPSTQNTTLTIRWKRFGKSFLTKRQSPCYNIFPLFFHSRNSPTRKFLLLLFGARTLPLRKPVSFVADVYWIHRILASTAVFRSIRKSPLPTLVIFPPLAVMVPP